MSWGEVPDPYGYPQEGDPWTDAYGYWGRGNRDAFGNEYDENGQPVEEHHSFRDLFGSRYTDLYGNPVPPKHAWQEGNRRRSVAGKRPPGKLATGKRSKRKRKGKHKRKRSAWDRIWN